jgi:hypothetical protein
MKTKSITSLAALLGVAVILNASALAGPDPQLMTFLQNLHKERNAGSEKSVPTIALAGHRKAPKTAKPATKAASTVSVVPGPHGDNRHIYRR